MRSPARYLALFGLTLALAGCGTVRRAPEPEPPVRPVRSNPGVRPSPPRAEPVVEPTPAAPVPAAMTPRAVASESHYPVPRIWEWTLSNGTRILFRRSVGTPGRVHVRAWAPGGWAGLSGTRPGDLLADAGGLRLSLRAGEARVDGQALARDLPTLVESLADAFGGRVEGTAALSLETALDAALVGGVPTEGIEPRALAASFGRPGAFRVLIAGDVSPDTVIALAGTALGRVRPAAEAYLVTDGTGADGRAPARTVRHPGDGQGRGALVGFRGVPEGPTAERAPDDVRAGLDVLAQAIASVLEAEGLPARTTIAWDGREATLSIDVREGEPAELARRVLRVAGALEITAPVVARARGAAIDAHNRAVQTPEGWIDWLTFLTTVSVDPRAAHRYPATLRAVPVERVRVLAEALFDPTRAAIVEIGDD